jgi:hypothetical protein
MQSTGKYDYRGGCFLRDDPTLFESQLFYLDLASKKLVEVVYETIESALTITGVKLAVGFKEYAKRKREAAIDAVGETLAELLFIPKEQINLLRLIAVLQVSCELHSELFVALVATEWLLGGYCGTSG